MRAENYITMEFPSRSVNEGFARMAVASFAAQLDPTLEELGDIKTAVRIVVKARLLEGGGLEVTVRDWGRGIPDIAKAREPLYTTGGEERSGMGFTIMESFMDTLRVTSKEGQGTKVVMRRRIVQRLSGR